MMQLLRNLWQKRGGTAAVEFAFALPLLIVMLMGAFEVSQALIVYMKVIDAADTVSDLIAQQKQIAEGDLDNYYIAGQLVMSPSPGAGLQLAVASVVLDQTTGNPSVAWHIEEGGAAAMTDLVATVTAMQATPPGVGSKGDSVIVAQATYTYNSTIKYVLPQGITISSRVYSRPRVVFTIPCIPCS
jgi:Flp pilus assembly protein TadG